MGVDVKADVKLDATKPAEIATEGGVKALSRLFSLACSKKETDNARYRALVAAQTDKDCQAIICGEAEFRDGQVVPISLPSTGNVVLDVEQQQGLENLQGNLMVAYHQLKDVSDEEVSDNEVDPDFFARWRREAKVIGERDLQCLWGKVLSEEIKSPDSISFRTLDVVKNLTKREAEVFHKVSGYVFDMLGLIHVENKTVVTYRDVVVLAEAGLVVPSVNGTLSRIRNTVFFDGVEWCYVKFEGYVFVVNASSANLSCTLLTEAGKQLYKIMDKKVMSSDDFKYVAEAVRPKGGRVSVRVYPTVGDNSINTDRLCFKYGN